MCSTHKPFQFYPFEYFLGFDFELILHLFGIVISLDPNKNIYILYQYNNITYIYIYIGL